MPESKNVVTSLDSLDHANALLSRPDMERACLSCLLVKPSLILEVESFLRDDDFLISHHRILFSVLKRLALVQFTKKLEPMFDSITVLDYLKLLGIENEYLASNKGLEYLESLRSSISLLELDNFKHYIQEIRSFGLRRSLYREGLSIQSMVLNKKSEDVGTLLSRAETKLFEIHMQASMLQRRPIQIGEGLRQWLEERFNAPKEVIGVPTGFPSLDTRILGLWTGSLTILAAKYKRGKSAMLQAIGLNVAKMGIPVYMISTEMQDTEIQSRAVANFAGISLHKIMKGQCGEEEKQKIHRAVDLLEKIPFTHLHVTNYTLEELLALIKRYVYQQVGFDEKGKTKPCLVLLDYIKMSDKVDKNSWVEHEWQALGEFSKKLKELASNLNIPILSAAQLNEQGKVAAAARLNWNCDTLLQWESYAEELSEEQKRAFPIEKWLNVFKLEIVLSRNSGNYMTGLPFRFFADSMQIVEAPDIVFSPYQS